MIVVFSGAATNVYSQKKTLEAGEFYASVRDADKTRYAASRRETRKDEEFTDGKLTSTTVIIDEYIKPDKQHFLSTETANGKVKKLEVIAIGKNYYQREDGGAWTKLKNWYGSGGLITSPLGAKSAFTVEDAKINNRSVKIYTDFTTFKNDHSDGNVFSEIKRWITNDGRLLKEEVTVGVLETKKVNFKRTYNYEYNLKNLKIVAPIK